MRVRATRESRERLVFWRGCGLGRRQTARREAVTYTARAQAGTPGHRCGHVGEQPALLLVGQGPDRRIHGAVLIFVQDLVTHYVR